MDFDVRVLPQLSSMILQLIATVVLFFILRHFLYKPVSKFMNERKEGIQSDIDDAKALKSEAIELKSEYEFKINEAKTEGQKIIEDSRKRGEEIKQDIVNEARVEANSIMEKARVEIEREKEKALEEIKLQAGEMAILIASKVIDKNLDMNLQKDMIDKFVDEVGVDKWQN
ncbi:F0F1 ATP synthase subunit B [Sporanaerobacter acetigenes]|uniref:ATP synthase subunit b n=1 Tax=Sporanaerobacter acetigenes DSM 13106 TaxID=1123281 RepID=A0A1M5SXD5_9FIRM|nr:F0F1 ATP synthase subunit B [Sporanaerobacter acetigenes]SHH42888.1 F-type H+-transporting ATPase subunit b [Sporanaerobacter acetigenes DSM 13106]